MKALITVVPSLALLFSSWGCCTTIPEVDSDVPILSLRVFDSQDSRWYRADDPDAFAHIFPTEDELVFVQVYVEDEGGIRRVLVRSLDGQLVHRNDTYTFEHSRVGNIDVLLHLGDPECADDKLNKVFEARPRLRGDVLAIRVLAEDFGGMGGTPNQVESGDIQVDFR